MVAKHDAEFRLVSSPQPLGRLIESSMMLGLASARACFAPALAYGLAGLLPMLAVDDLLRRLLHASSALVLDAIAPWLPRVAAADPLDLLYALLAWARQPSTLALFGLTALAMLAALSLLLPRQSQIASGVAARLPWRTAFERLPRVLAAWLAYLALLLLSTAPLLAWIAMAWIWSGTDLSLPQAVAVLLLFALGALALSVPLAWASVAYGFAPLLAAIDGDGPRRALRRSRERVRGRWVHAALVTSVPMLIYLGVGSAVSTLSTLILGMVTYLAGGWPALLDGGWLLQAQLLGLVPMALALPLATAGLVVGWHDLSQRG